jgi:hypothetical protein
LLQDSKQNYGYARILSEKAWNNKRPGSKISQLRPTWISRWGVRNHKFFLFRKVFTLRLALLGVKLIRLLLMLLLICSWFRP